MGGGFGEGYRIRGGWDWKDNDPNPLPTLTNNTIENHGTPIAGIMGALNNNNTGVIGIAGGWNTINSGCQVFSFRVSSDDLDEYGRRLIDESLIAEALIEAVTDPSINNGFGYGIDVVNCSFSGLTPNYWDWSTLFYQSYYNAFVWAFLNDVVVSVSRGNSGTSTPRYPASFSNGKVLLSVSGVNNSGNFHTNSSYGDGVSLSANWTLNYTTKNNYNYGSFSGTSNSAPFVSGSSALIFSKYLERGMEILGDDVQQILKISAQDAGAGGYDQYYGFGRLDVAKALYLSSNKFNLTHLVANKNRNVQSVSNPPGGILALYYPYGLYPVIETKKLTETVEIPEGFDLDSTWLWGNSYSWGLEWGNPSYGIPGATLVSQNGRDFTFTTYIYKLVSLGGGSTFWWPNEPQDLKINVSILGKYTPIVPPIIDDLVPNPDPFCQNRTNVLTCVLSQGSGTKEYIWWDADKPSNVNINYSGNKAYVTYTSSDNLGEDAPQFSIYCKVKIGPYYSNIASHFVTSIASCPGCPTLAFEVNGALVDENPLLITSLSNPRTDVTDYYLINTEIEPVGDEINFTIHEPQTEHTWLDYVELIEAKVKSDELVAVNDEGEVINYKKTTAPVTVMLNDTTDITEILSEIDTFDISLSEGDILTVYREELLYGDNDDGDMVLGGEVPPPAKEQVSFTISVNREKDIDQGIQSNEDDNPPLGGLFFRPNKSIIAKSLRNLPPGNLDITINKNLVLDYLALVKNKKTAKVTSLDLLSATHNQSGDVKSLLLDIDRNYVEIYPGEIIDFIFQKGNTPAHKRRYILKTVGRYETDSSLVFGKNGNLSETLENNLIPKENKLFDNYPNPFNPTTQIKYSVKENGLVTLKVYDVLGKEVAALVNEEKQAGTYTVNFNAGTLASGIYFYKISTKDFQKTKKMLLIK